MRLLPKRPHTDRGCTAQELSKADGQRHRGIDGWQFVPLWNVRSYSAGDQSGRGAALVGGTMQTAMTSNVSPISRRTFLRVSSAAAGCLFISLYLDWPAIAQQPPKPQIYPPDAFVHVRPDGKIVIQVNRLEFGQGVQT